MTEEKKSGTGPRRPGKIQAPVVAAVVLVAVMLITLAAGLSMNRASGAAPVSGSASEGQAAGPAETETASGTDAAPPEENTGSGAVSAPSSAASDDGYALPAESRDGTRGTSSAAPQGPARQTAPGGTESRSSSEGSSAQADGYSGPKISREEYDALQKGMTLAEAETAVGGPGRLVEENGNTELYEWPGFGPSDSYARVTFRSGKLAFKIQFGL